LSASTAKTSCFLISSLLMTLPVKENILIMI